MDGAEECRMHVIEDMKAELNSRAREQQQQRGGNAYDSSDDEDGGGAQRVQCAQQ